VAKRLRDYQLASQIENRRRLYEFECPYYEDPRVQLDRLMAQAKRRSGPGDQGSMPASAEAARSETEDAGQRTEDGERETDNSTREVQDEAATAVAE
jgi:hypothetical protein